MSPVGRPTPDGEIVHGSRHFSGKPSPLGEVRLWDCPACGKKNEGQRPEHGCVHCGAGDPRKAMAGSGESGPLPVAAPAPRRVPALLPASTSADPSPWAPAGPRPAPAPVRILRLLEYLIAPGQTADETLRRSLVGTLEMGWGRLTATIVDSCDARQEDLLTLARKQPGVWMNKEPLPPGVVTYEEGTQKVLAQFEEDHRRRQDPPAVDWCVVPLDPQVPVLNIPQEARMNPPDTGPAYSVEEAALAADILACGHRAMADGGYKLCYTLALALQTIAEELAMTMEPERFLTREQALALANALMQQIPAEWVGEQPDAQAPAAGQET